MKAYSLSIMFLSVCLINVMAQSEKHFCDNILANGWAAYEKEKYSTALQYLQDVETCDYENDLLTRRQELQTAIFKAIQEQNNKIQAALKEAELQRKKAFAAQKEAEQQESVAVKEKLKAQKLTDFYLEKSQGNFARALLRLDQYYALAPEDSLKQLLILEKANVLASMGENDEAEKLFNKLLDLVTPEDRTRYFLMRAEFFLKNNKLDKAIQDCISWVNTGKLGKINLAGIAVNMFESVGKGDEIDRLLLQIVEVSGDSIEKGALLQYLSEHYDSQDDPDKAIEAIDLARQWNSNNLDYLAQKATLLAKHGKREDAQRLFREFVERNGITEKPRDTTLAYFPDITFRIWENEELVIVTDDFTIASFKKLERAKWKGIYTVGSQAADEFINWNSGLISANTSLSGSLVYVASSIAKNEGKFEAINAYDGAFLSFGMAQWTLGVGNSVGELPALMNRIKTKAPEVFHQHFGTYGIDVSPETNSQAGYLQLAGKTINTRDDKEQFRDPVWVFLFSKAAQDPIIKAIQVEHLMARLNTFYDNDKYKVNDFTLDKIITSEFGVALLLDNHINLPGLVKKAVGAAMDETGLTDPAIWTNEDEQKVLEA